MDDQTPNFEPDEAAAQPAAPRPPVALPAPQPAVARVPLRERVLGLRAVAAVALASVVLGGAGGAALAAAGAGDDDGTSGGRFGPPGQNGVPFQNGQLPNGQTPSGTLPQTTDPDSSDGVGS